MTCQWRVIHIDVVWDDVSLDAAVIARWPRPLAEQHQVLPIQLDLSVEPVRLRVVAVQPHNPWVKDHLIHQFCSVGEVEVVQISPMAFTQLLIRAYQDQPHPLTFHESKTQPFRTAPSLINPDEHEIVSFVDALLRHGLTQHATDIHFEPCEDGVIIRLRHDGLLRVFSQIALRSWPQICGRLKVLGNMDLTEQRFPQNGRFTFHDQFQKVDCRVASHPCLFGEKITIRLLPQNQQISDLARLGFSEEQQHTLRHMIRHPEGMIILCGPTGSGKTTTLYSLLHELDRASRNVMTLEDPVEYHIQGISQTDLSKRSALSFPEGVRSLLRQDPDVILIGEIRDEETARMSLRAAVTGHQVLTTLHVRSIPSVMVRLEDLGVSMYGLRENIMGIVHQRLIRLICTSCSEKVPFPEYPDLHASLVPYIPRYDYRAVGCHACHLTGYQGRTVLAEIVSRRDFTEQEQFSAMPDRSLWHAALQKIDQGLTNFQECERLLGPLAL